MVCLSFQQFVTQTNIAVLYEKWNRHEEALAAHEKTMALAKETRDAIKFKHRIATAKQNYGLYLESRGDSRAGMFNCIIFNYTMKLINILILDEYLAEWKAYCSLPSSSRDDICSQEGSDEEDKVDLENLSSTFKFGSVCIRHFKIIVV
jgi:hypothetical protein